MQIRKLWQNRWPLLRWGLFILALGAIAAGLYMKLPPEPRWVRAGDPKGVFFAGEGRFAAYPLTEGAASGPLQLWDAATGSEVDCFLSGDAPFQAYASSEDGRRFVAVLKGDTPDVWRIRGVDLQERREWQADARVGSFGSATFSPHCDFVALRMKPAEDAEEFYTLVETSSGRTVAHLPGAAEQITFGGNGGCLAAGYSDEENRRQIRAVSTRTGKTTVIADAGLLGVSPDSRWLIGDRGDEGVWLWDVAGSRWHAPLGEPKAQPSPLQLHHRNYTVALPRGMKFLAASRYYVKTITARRATIVRRGAVWEKYSSLFLSNSADGRMFSPDSRLVLCTTSPEVGQPDWTLYDVQTAKPLWKRSWEKHPQEPLFTPDSRRIVVVLPDAEHAEVLNAATGRTEQTLSLFGSAGASAGLTRDGRTLVVAATPPDEEPYWLLAKIEEWLAPRPDTAPAVFRAFALEAGVSLGELRTEETDQHWLTDDRQSLVTVDSENDEQGLVATTIRCWDMPPHKPLRWALGAPLALGFVVLSLNLGWRRLRRGKAVQVKITARDPETKPSNESS